MSYNFILQSNKEEIVEQLHLQMETGLEECGLVAEGYAKRLCPVGTPESTGIKGYIGGTLRNSITHALDGEPTSISTYTDNNGNVKGEYNGSTQKSEPYSKCVYIGTNVEYAPYVEMGYIHAMSGKHVAARPFIEPAVKDHPGQYARILNKHMQ